MTFNRPASARKAFTLVELLVVIGIISVLIAILLPALTKARKAANNIKCSANLRSIVQAMQVYAAQNNGAIMGSALTSGRMVTVDPVALNAGGLVTVAPGISEDNMPSICGIFDWMSPAAKIMGVRFNEGPTRADRLQRFEALRNYPGFQCPENQFLAGSFSGSPINVPIGPMVSYNTAMGFLVANNPTGGNNTTPYSGGTTFGPVGKTMGRTDQNPPQGYNVKIGKVGPASRKIYVADGGRFSNSANAPDLDLNLAGTNGGAFSDQGACAKFTQAWDRNMAPGNTRPSTAQIVDARIYAFRHGSGGRRAPADRYKFNVAFFDGHVEMLGDLEGSNPEFWFPKNTTFGANTTQIWEDTLAKFYNNQPTTVTLP